MTFYDLYDTVNILFRNLGLLQLKFLFTNEWLHMHINGKTKYDFFFLK